MTKRIYVASSWRNVAQPAVVVRLREAGYKVYDFRNPEEGDKGFHWTEIEGTYRNWTPTQYIEALNHPLALSGFHNDYDAMDWADTCVLLLPCGRSAHLEAGWFAGEGKKLFIVLRPETATEELVPELMYKMATKIVVHTNDLLTALKEQS